MINVLEKVVIAVYHTLTSYFSDFLSKGFWKTELKTEEYHCCCLQEWFADKENENKLVIDH